MRQREGKYFAAHTDTRGFCQKCNRLSFSPETMAKELEWALGEKGMSVVSEYLK